MNKLLILPVVFVSAAAQAVCIPTNEFHTIFLGMSSDSNSYATGTSERVLLWKDEKPEALLYRNRICYYRIADNSTIGECEDVDSNTNNISKAKDLLRKEFKKSAKGWSLGQASSSQKQDFFTTLDCEQVTKESAQCLFEFRKPRHERYLDLMWSHTVPLRATFDVSPLFHKSDEIYFSKDKKNMCVRFERVAHQSANCGSREDVVVCGLSDSPPLE